MQNKLKIFMFLYLKYIIFIIFWLAVLLPAVIGVISQGRSINHSIDIQKTKAISEFFPIPFDKIFSKDGFLRIMDVLLIPAFFITLHEMTVGFSCVLWFFATIAIIFTSWINGSDLIIELRQSIGLTTPMIFITTYFFIVLMKFLRIYNLFNIFRFFR
jgi:hypothetical protein